MEIPWLRARRWSFSLLVAATTALGTLGMIQLVGSGGLRPLEIVLLVLFTATFGWISVAFWTGTLGFVLSLLRRDPLTLRPLPSRATPPRTEGRAKGSGAEDPGPERPQAEDAEGNIVGRTAVVMPVYNEDPDRVVPALRATVRSLARTGNGDRFDAFLLSDTDDPGVAGKEERLWTRWERAASGSPSRGHRRGEPVPDEAGPDPRDGAEAAGGAAPHSFSATGFGSVTYRRRAENTGHKAGNIAEFCHRWGADYDYMVVLDADSLMTGATLVTLARFMDHHPETGLLQTVPVPARQETLLGRLLQFAQALHAPLFAAGQCFWQGETANYWGHNAIVRVRPFMDHCRLPVLKGSPPLGGRILSHDFVEAALLRRAGWKVYLDPWLEGSYEGVPGTLPAYAIRDRRWSQGSLQHLRLLGAKGLHPLSRIHFTFGALGYVSSVLWLLLLLASTAYVILPDPENSLRIGAQLPVRLPTLLSLLLVTAVVLLLSRFFALLLALKDRASAFGGPWKLAFGFLLETLHSIVVAPVLMMYHTRFVGSVLAGRNVSWGSQDREGRRVSWRTAWRSAGWMTLLGLLWAGLTLYHSVTFFLWLSPIFAGLLTAVPLIRFTSRRRWGSWTREHGLFLVPAETEPHNVLRESERPVNGETPMPPSRGTARMHPDDRGTEGLASSRRRAGPFLEPGSPRHSSRGHVETRPFDSDPRPAERVLLELQRGYPVVVTGPTEARLLGAVESLGADTLSQLQRHGSDEPLRLVVTHRRARAMGLLTSTSDDASDPSWSLCLSANGATPDAARILELSTGLDPEIRPPVDLRPASLVERSTLELLRRRGRMLPALVSAGVDDEEDEGVRAAVNEGRLLRIGADEIRAVTEDPGVRVVPVSDSRVPLEGAEEARFFVFRERPGLQEHLAVIIGERDEWPDPLPVRLHSACLTGDLFGSLRCDCGEQLRRSLEYFSDGGGGVLLYLSQEGRSIGLANKLRAYALQQDGLDTVDANRALGFEDDERRYEVAVAMLDHLDIRRVELLTNNPEKMRALEAGGIEVAERIPLHGTLNRHNLPYVSAKVHRAGHWLDEMLGSRLSEGPGDGP